MGFVFSPAAFNLLLQELKKDFKVYAPVLLKGKGRFSDTDTVGYGEINKIEDVVFDSKSYFSPKETFYPINQTLFYFTEDEYREPKIDPKGIVVFLRSCDIHAVQRLDKIMLENGPAPDYYYKQLRDKLKFILMDCPHSFDSCFCVSMGTNRTDNYSASVRPENGSYLCHVQEDINGLFASFGQPQEVTPLYVTENKITVNVPANLDLSAIIDHPIWQEYGRRCVSCGRCNTSCPTCSCFTMQDIFYQDNPKCGERRRVWASCQIDGFTDMAGGHSFRREQSQRMRFKVLHKVYDFKERFGIHMCVGCGRCDDVCPEYISFSRCVNKLAEAVQEVK
ncbi:sulfite reductase, subunit A [Desulfotomaculum nigrificans CO-1-SRB]|uniref:Sulfite reductase, subunit A n=1 Tax=Desulfotomaculum nigrificans (strain DSM 14880 / VKM B-2319 / CO-1-SRB) TaxID=868595 RepID=F6B6X5_DESCC|nr:anaerobic sulfite reductase subunit AsrA [Desulfotomaculum nigrificans]AEF93300.1 sulfite reductase, subunit A [Desulfotomaculum nigrificans CO-1-SRB]